MNTAKLSVITSTTPSSSATAGFESTFDDSKYPHLAPFAECDRLSAAVKAAQRALIGFANEMAGLLKTNPDCERFRGAWGKVPFQVDESAKLAGTMRIINALGDPISLGRDEEQMQRLARYVQRLAAEGRNGELLTTLAHKMLRLRGRGTLAALEKLLAEIDSKRTLKKVTKD